MEIEQAGVKDEGISRRRLIKGIAAGFGALAIGSITGHEDGPLNNLPTNEAEAHDEVSGDEIFDSLKSLIENSSENDTDKTTSLEILNNFSHISKVNDVLISEYKRNADATGKPELLIEAEKKYENYGVDDIEALIVFVANDKLVKEMIITPLLEIHKRGILNAGELLNTLSLIEQNIGELSATSGEQKYRWGPQLTLLDYAKFGTERGGTIEVGRGGEIINNDADDEESDKFHEHKNEIEELLKRFPFPGDLKVNAMSAETYKNNPGYVEGFAGRILEKSGLSEVNINLEAQDIAYILLHEVAGHGLDAALNDIQISRYVSPETFFKLVLAREKALNSQEWGRNYPSTETIFANKDSNRISSASSLYIIREIMDLYPDTIFVRGFHGHKPLGGEENPWLQRKVDKETVNEYIGLFQDRGDVSNSLVEFFEDSNNIKLLETISQGSNWLSIIIDKVKENAELLGRTKWIKDAGYDVPNGIDSNDKWFNYIMTIGQRLVVADMFAKNDQALSILTEEEKSIFRENLIKSAIRADEELFANMMAASLMNERIGSQTPNPYIGYLEILSKALEDDKTSVIPTQALVAQVKNAPSNTRAA